MTGVVLHQAWSRAEAFRAAIARDAVLWLDCVLTHLFAAGADVGPDTLYAPAQDVFYPELRGSNLPRTEWSRT